MSYPEKPASALQGHGSVPAQRRVVEDSVSDLDASDSCEVVEALRVSEGEDTLHQERRAAVRAVADRLAHLLGNTAVQ